VLLASIATAQYELQFIRPAQSFLCIENARHFECFTV
jgi:hypothetical protein